MNKECIHFLGHSVLLDYVAFFSSYHEAGFRSDISETGTARFSLNPVGEFTNLTLLTHNHFHLFSGDLCFKVYAW